MKIQEIKEALQQDPGEELLQSLKDDPRTGVQKLLTAYYKKLEQEKQEKIRFSVMMKFENECYDAGAEYVAGVDEAGRGPLAGPLVIAAVILPQDVFISGLNDSKQISAKKREQLYQEIMEKAAAVSVDIVSVSNIDRLNIYQATQQGMNDVLNSLELVPDVALIDAMPVENEKIKTISIVHGDALSISIAAASVVAKVTRDRIMDKLDKIYPQYKFASNKGYGSREHMQALAEYGAVKWHRRSYEPIKSMGIAAAEQQEDIIYSPLNGGYEYEP